MSIKATFISEAARLVSELKEISEKENGLRELRQQTEASLWAIMVSVGELEAAGYRSSDAGAPAFVPPVPPGSRTRDKGNGHMAARREYMKAAVDACRDILIANGSPMQMDDIHAVHPERLRLSRRALYMALDQRCRYDVPTFIAHKGVIWVPDLPFPKGWVHPKGTPWEHPGPTIQIPASDADKSLHRG